jgi:hypothetical protein
MEWGEDCILESEKEYLRTPIMESKERAISFWMRKYMVSLLFNGFVFSLYCMNRVISQQLP